MRERILIHRFTARFRSRDAGPWQIIDIGAGVPHVERVVPPAGEMYAFDYIHWPRKVQIAVSPSGRSVRVHVDGVEIPAPTPTRGIRADHSDT